MPLRAVHAAYAPVSFRSPSARPLKVSEKSAGDSRRIVVSCMPPMGWNILYPTKSSRSLKPALDLFH